MRLWKDKKKLGTYRIIYIEEKIGEMGNTVNGSIHPFTKKLASCIE